MEKNIKISKRTYPKGEDGYKVFSIRIPEDLKAKLDEIADASGRSRNEIISAMLAFGVEHYEIVE